MPEIFWLAENLLASQEGLYSIQLFIYLGSYKRWWIVPHRVEV